MASPEEQNICVCGHARVEHEKDGTGWCSHVVAAFDTYPIHCQCEVYTAETREGESS